MGRPGRTRWVDPMGNNPQPAQDDSCEARNCNQEEECSGPDRRARLFFSADSSSRPVCPVKRASFLSLLPNNVLLFCLKADVVLLLVLEASGCVRAAPQQGI